METHDGGLGWKNQVYDDGRSRLLPPSLNQVLQPPTLEHEVISDLSLCEDDDCSVGSGAHRAAIKGLPRYHDGIASSNSPNRVVGAANGRAVFPAVDSLNRLTRRACHQDVPSDVPTSRDQDLFVQEEEDTNGNFPEVSEMATEVDMIIKRIVAQRNANKFMRPDIEGLSLPFEKSNDIPKVIIAVSTPRSLP